MNVMNDSPYCLRGGDGDSDRFYRDCSRFADEVLAYAETAAGHFQYGLIFFQHTWKSGSGIIGKDCKTLFGLEGWT